MVNQKQFDKLKLDLIGCNFIEENGSNRYILEFDLVYPDKLHELHNDYPLDSEKLEISDNMLSDYCSNIGNEYGIKFGSINKLIPN